MCLQWAECCIGWSKPLPGCGKERCQDRPAFLCQVWAAGVYGVRQCMWAINTMIKSNQNETPPFFSAVVHSRRCQSGDRSFNGRPEEECGCGELPLPFAPGSHQGMKYWSDRSKLKALIPSRYYHQIVTIIIVLLWLKSRKEMELFPLSR